MLTPFRRRLVRLFYTSTMTVLILSSSVMAENLPTVSLQDVLAEVTRTNPAISEAMEYYESVAAEREMATAGYLPTIGTEITAGPERTDGVATEEVTNDGVTTTEDVTSNLTSTTATLYARQNIFNGFKTDAYVDETDARIKAAAYEVLNVANNVYLSTAEAYINVVKAAKLLDIAKQNAITQEKIMRQVREKTDAGFNRVSELYNSESRLALSKGSYISRQQDLNQALAVFHRQFGRFLSPEQFTRPDPQYMVPDTLNNTVEKAFRYHPALKVAEYNIATKRYTYEKTSGDYWPTLDLELKGQYRNDTGGDEGEVKQAGAYLTLSYTFFDGGLRSGATARDKLAIRKEHQRSYIERRNVNQSVRLAWNIMEAEADKRSYLSEHVRLSAKTLDAFKEEYYVGRRTLLDLLNMENEYTDAKISQADSQYSYLTALYRIMQSTGELLTTHDTGLFERLDLPKTGINDIDEEVYEDLDLNRDRDSLADSFDQCDATVNQEGEVEYGCDNIDQALVGYPDMQGEELKPYIVPESTIPEEPAVSQEEKPAILLNLLTLEAKPDGKSIIDADQLQLDQFTEALLLHPEMDVVITGHVASDNDTEENLKLSESRAAIIKQYMVDRGVAAHRITTIGKGGLEPLASNATSSGRKMNRRIEIKASDS